MGTYTTHAIQLVLSALLSALHNNPRPAIFHSDNGSEYNAKVFLSALTTIGIAISRSTPGCPWENDYQESFHSQLKVELGDPNRFNTLGELVYEIYRIIYSYNHTRIHSALKSPPSGSVIYYQPLQGWCLKTGSIPYKNTNLKYYDMGSTFLQMAKEARKIYVNRRAIDMVDDKKLLLSLLFSK